MSTTEESKSSTPFTFVIKCGFYCIIAFYRVVKPEVTVCVIIIMIVWLLLENVNERGIFVGDEC